MTHFDIENINVSAFDAMPSPEEIHARLPLSPAAASLVMNGREVLRNILDRRDRRLFVVVGPCSIHDPIAGLDYARRLKALADEVSETLYLVMRVYFEKPRTTTGWKGFINDPHLDDSFQIEKGMELGRRFLREVTALGLPAATEALDPISPQYYGDLISWTAIGARTAESQTHREMASGLSTPVGFKNGTDGSIEPALNAIISASHPHSFLGLNENPNSIRQMRIMVLFILINLLNISIFIMFTQKLKTKKTIILVALVILVTFGLLIYLIANPKTKTPEELAKIAPDDVYVVSIETVLDTGQFFTSVVHRKDQLVDDQNKLKVNYDTKTSAFAIDRPFFGYDCGTIANSATYKDQTLFLTENLNKDCEEKQTFYLTSLITDRRPFENIVLDQQVNGKSVKQYKIEIAR